MNSSIPDNNVKFKTSSEAVLELARPELLARSAYVSASPDRSLIRLHANENPWSIEQSGTDGEAEALSKITALGTVPGSEASNAGHYNEGAIPQRELNRYPEARPQQLAEAMAAYYRLPPECVLPVRGSDDGIDLLVRAFCQAGKDSVLISSPAFAMYASFAQIQNAAVIDIPLIDEAGEFSLDVPAITEMADKVKLIFLCTPNNPSGHSVSPLQIEQLCHAIAGRAVLVVDEAYIEFSHHQSVCSLIQQLANVVVLRTLSKAFGAAGIRCGAVLAHANVINLLQSITTAYAMPTPVVELALEGLSEPSLRRMKKQCQYLVQHCQQLAEALSDHPMVQQVYRTDANFVLVRFSDAAAVHSQLKQQGILVRDFSKAKGCEGCLRITVGQEHENRRVLSVLDSLVRSAGSRSAE